jgi:hypothetical protein
VVLRHHHQDPGQGRLQDDRRHLDQDGHPDRHHHRSRTVTKTQCVATSTVCANKWKKDEIPDELTNAERLQYGLPPRGPGEKRKRTFWGGGGNNGPSCTPTTVVTTATTTKTVPGTVTVSSTSCYLTKTNTAYNTKTTTATSTCWTTTKGPAVTKTVACATATTTTVRTTATVTKKCYW